MGLRVGRMRDRRVGGGIPFFPVLRNVFLYWHFVYCLSDILTDPAPRVGFRNEVHIGSTNDYFCVATIITHSPPAIAKNLVFAGA
jgi:hypothetical protein